MKFFQYSRQGWRGGKNAVLGIGAGFLCVMVLCAVFCYELSSIIPAAAEVLKYVGAVYILWLAYHIWKSTPEEEGAKPVTFGKGFILQFANVKIIMYAITSYLGYVLPKTDSLTDLLLHAVCFTAVGVSGTVTWAAAGGLLQSVLNRHYKGFNLVMALVLVLCAVSML